MTDPKSRLNEAPQASTTSANRRPATTSKPLVARRNILFLAILASSALLFWQPIRTLIEYSSRGEHKYDQYTITVLIPFISVALLYAARKRIFAAIGYGFKAGIVLLLAGVASEWMAQLERGNLGIAGALSLAILGLVIFWLGGFALCYGGKAFRAGLFPLLFLLLTVPLPSVLLNGPVGFVRWGSADVASAVFNLFGAPVLRNGLVFTLPVLSIRVAEECSGIHSILALFIIALLAGYMTNQPIWRRLVLLALVFPIVCLTNGLRISAIALLSNYVNPAIIHSSLHRDGGFLFFGMAMVVLFGVLRLIGVRRRKPPQTLPGGMLPSSE